MQGRKETAENITERVRTLASDEICALFLLSADREGTAGPLPEEEEAEQNRIAAILPRFFRQTDITGNLGKGFYAAFLAGNVTGNAVYEKTAALIRALQYSWEEGKNAGSDSWIGVYMFRAQGDSFEYLLRKAEYALEMAKKENRRHFYIYISEDIREEVKQENIVPVPSQMMQRYIDEGVRLIEVGPALKTLYMSPGFYRRLAASKDTMDARMVQIHPEDREAYEEYVRQTAASGKAGNYGYRISLDGQKWISCRIRLLPVQAGDETHNPVVIEVSHNTDGLERLRNQLNEKREWLNFVAEHTEYQLWEVDISRKVFRMLYSEDLMDGRKDVYSDFPESLIENGRIHSSSAKEFREFSQKLLGGQMRGTGNFIVQYRQTSCYGWAAMSYRMICDEDGHPAKAIGIKEDLSCIPYQQTGVIRRRMMPADMYSRLYCFLQANLTSDTVENLLLEGRERIRLIQYQTFGQIIAQGVSRLFSREDARRFQEKFSRERMLEEFKKGRYWFYDTCRMVDLNGKICWISVAVNVSRDSETRDVCLYAYLNRLDQRTEWEKLLEKPAQTDPDTGVYTAGTQEKLVRKLLEQKNFHACILGLIRIEGADELFREESSLRKKQDIVTALHVFLNTDCLVGLKDETSLLVFFPNENDAAKARGRLERVFSFVRLSLNEMKEMKFIRLVGAIVGGNKERSSLEQMMSEASWLCGMHANEATDVADVYQIKDGEYWKDARISGQTGRMEQRPLELSRMLSEEDKDMVLECMELMLKADNEKDSVNGVLCKIGLYYQADRVYILTLTENKKIMTMQNEWVGPGKYTIQQSVTGKTVSHFPVIANYVQNPEPIVLSARDEKGRITWQYAMFPMDSTPDTQLLLCIENPKRYLEQTGLLDKLLPCLSLEKTRFHEGRSQTSALDRFCALPNQESCREVMYSVDSDTYSSLGVMAMDVPEYERVKKEKGFEYGRQLLLRISEAMLEVFGQSLLFHTKEEEFVVFCTNITYHSFLNLCARSKQMVGRQYAGLFRMGCTWADGVFQARDLLTKARSIMKCDTPQNVYEPEFRPPDEEKDLLNREIQAEFKSRGQMTIYLQPKINMQDGSLMGAEALVRVLDENGKLLPHGRIIEAMEREGSIQKLDYFVFDRMLDTLNGWRKKGYDMFAVSSNFSRKTLLNPAALASVLAILSRYPRVPLGLVELEITETAGDFENNTFEELIRRFGYYGLQFSLDDFGSGYSNTSMLTNLHFHSVKLDRSLIRNMQENQVSRMIVRDLVNICRSCGMTCIAEGVENQEQADLLLEDGCKCAQGFYYDRPMPLEEFEEKYLRIRKEGGV